MTNFHRVAMLALGLLVIESSAPALAQPNGDRISAWRAAAIRSCDHEARADRIVAKSAVFAAQKAKTRECQPQSGERLGGTDAREPL